MFVYDLFDPINKVVFYVGQTGNIKLRFDTHIGLGERFHSGKRDWRLKDRWIAYLLEDCHVEPEIRQLEQGVEASEIDRREAFWMVYRLAEGCPLGNNSYISTIEWGLTAKRAKKLARTNSVGWALSGPDCDVQRWILQRWGGKAAYQPQIGDP